jgi:carboxymethylenebutenolidase
MTTSGEWISLGDGSRAYHARPDGTGPFPSVVIFIEAFGLNDHFKRLTQRFAAAGFAAVTPDLYDGAVYSYDDMPAAIGHMQRLSNETALARTEQALAFLEGQPEARTDAVGAIGFCMGGYLTFLANLALPARFEAAASFYGSGIGAPMPLIGRQPLLERVGSMQAPLQLWYGGQDRFIRPDEHGRIAEALSTAGKDFTLTVFAEATHGFFCEDRSSYHEPSAERAWRSVLAFFRDHLA